MKQLVRPRKMLIVADLESLERWQTIPLDRLHEINREEVDKLLRKARQLGVRALTNDERDFLDRMSGSG